MAVGALVCLLGSPFAVRFQIPGLWSPLFGFGDAYSLDPHYLSGPYDEHGNPTSCFAGYLNGPWINHMTMGIDVGPLLLAIENYRSGSIWKLTARSPVITCGLDRIFGLGATQPLVGPDGGAGGVSLKWKPVAGASVYNIYSSLNRRSWHLREQSVHGISWTDQQTAEAGQWHYLIKAIGEAVPAHTLPQSLSLDSSVLTSGPKKVDDAMNGRTRSAASRGAMPASRSASVQQQTPAG